MTVPAIFLNPVALRTSYAYDSYVRRTKRKKATSRARRRSWPAGAVAPPKRARGSPGHTTPRGEKRKRGAPGTPGAGGSGGVRILLVDDEHVLRDLLRQTIEHMTGFEVVGEASNGYEALDRVDELEPDVVVMDARMPVMDGVQATRLIAQRYPEVTVLATSCDPEAVQAMLEAGAAGQCPKRDIRKLTSTLEGLAGEENSP